MVAEGFKYEPGVIKTAAWIEFLATLYMYATGGYKKIHSKYIKMEIIHKSVHHS